MNNCLVSFILLFFLLIFCFYIFNSSRGVFFTLIFAYCYNNINKILVYIPMLEIIFLLYKHTGV